MVSGVSPRPPQHAPTQVALLHQSEMSSKRVVQSAVEVDAGLAGETAEGEGDIAEFLDPALAAHERVPAVTADFRELLRELPVRRRDRGVELRPGPQVRVLGRRRERSFGVAARGGGQPARDDPGGVPARAFGPASKRSIATATPSLSFDAVISSTCATTSGWAFAGAIDRPAQASIGRSFG